MSCRTPLFGAVSDLAPCCSPWALCRGEQGAALIGSPFVREGLNLFASCMLNAAGVLNVLPENVSTA